MLKVADYDVVFSEIPDEVTLALNISNCPNACAGCHSPHLWENIGEPLDEGMMDYFLREYGHSVTCICFMGGDSDPSEVSRLASVVRAKAPHLKTGWYSGRENLSEQVDISNFDYIKTGPYMEKFGPLDCSTTNQRMYAVHDGKLTDITARFFKH